MRASSRLYLAVFLFAAGAVLRAQTAAPYPEFTGSFQREAAAPEESLTLWSRRPAKDATEALPAGDGRLAVLVPGGIVDESIDLFLNPGADASADVRTLLAEGQLHAAFTRAGLAGGHPADAAPVAQLSLSFDATEAVENYRRDLNLDTGAIRVAYAANGVRYSREVVGLPNLGVTVVRLVAETSGRLTVTVRLKGLGGERTTGIENGFVVAGQGEQPWQIRLKLVTDKGDRFSSNTMTAISSANSATLFIAAARGPGNLAADLDARLKAATAKPLDTLRRLGIAEHQRAFRRTSLDLGAPGDTPTWERLGPGAADTDPQLGTLAFQLSRYLAITGAPAPAYPRFWAALPEVPFAINGGAATAPTIAEAFVRVENGEIELLGAPPTMWSSGAVKGVRARGCEIDLDWTDGQFTGATLRGAGDDSCRLRQGDRKATVVLRNGKAVRVDRDLR